MKSILILRIGKTITEKGLKKLMADNNITARELSLSLRI